MIIFHSALAALCMLGTYMNIKTNPALAGLTAVCVGINIGMIIGYASGVM
ncbi:hypothetical protein pEaSNUABM56_00063 [Erwinia phage pEa_SNUABM_56]|uniref:Uncharacterized protein n=1 Tax=Erwinia phage pEp_SNUABM_01 TaxID=2601643 RepID=A0A5J6DB68_9CAUD|nr:hypothetical protein HWC63_gp037 [Erwinia phage pEp_SNUABM_01]QEQ94863.1 hypothetical protein pEpSNUABM01_037 [Erwinia phage pEp_SNUABM_01]UYL85041.1 hypothetical protein pEaSNUABM55_00268 [Erwinia phage pEa_SNUABM_55]UYL85108.1 hypothetical protein pEaSNUABM56_00063 [Erwinia phage pEa_SNUABM_56]